MSLAVKAISKYVNNAGIISIGKYELYDGRNLFCAIQIRGDSLVIGMPHGGKGQTGLPPEFVSALHSGKIERDYIEQLVKNSEPACSCEPCPKHPCAYRVLESASTGTEEI